MAQRPTPNTFAPGQLWKKVSISNRSPTNAGPLSWTLFVNSINFKGPLAFWIPETWTRLSETYPVLEGRGLDTRPGIIGSGAMEFNTVPWFDARDSQGILYSRLPKLRFPVDGSGYTTLMQDIVTYSSAAIYDQAKAWFNGGEPISGQFNHSATFWPTLTAQPLSFKKGDNGAVLSGFDTLVETRVVNGTSFALRWKNQTNQGSFPEYFKQQGAGMIAVAASTLPDSTQLKSQSFARAAVRGPYTSSGAHWSQPGPASVPFEVNLSDGTKVTYAWYRFVDQPAFQHLNLSDSQKQRWQSIVEQIHLNWRTTNEFIQPPTRGSLATLDAALLVTPPNGLETGYVPIVTKQEGMISQVYTQLTPAQLQGYYRRSPVENDWHLGTVSLVPDGSGKYRWRNEAGVSWTLEAALLQGVFLTGLDYPYSGNIPIILKRDPVTDDELPEVEAIQINGELYMRLPGLPPLNAKLQAGRVIISWDGVQRLQTATNLNGPWQTITVQSPYSVLVNQSSRFFRGVSP